MQTKNPSNLWGIDVSRWQGEIDWQRVKAAGVQFAFVKATDGIGWVDSQFRRNTGGAHAVGIPVGFYHYAHPELNTAIAEAENFVQTVKGLPVQLPYVLDVEGKAAEVGQAKLTKWCLTWLKEVQKRTGHRVMIYTGANFARCYLGSELAVYPLWVAHYGVDKPMVNGTWSRWSVFQHSEKGKVDGIHGNVDLNVMEKDFLGGEEYMMKPEDANKVIALLGSAYGICKTKEDREEFHRLANELRKASGQNIT